jgi:hypothetical protein
MISSCSDDTMEVDTIDLDTMEVDTIDLDQIMEIEDELIALISNNENFEENILLVVDHDVIKGVKNNLGRLIQDINQQEQNVYLEIEINHSFSDLKQTIRGHYQNNRINGSIFIGDVPIPKALIYDQFNNSKIGVSTQYYMDINGEFEFDENNTIVNHYGDRPIELWVSVIPSYGLDSIANINSYLDKNHGYRSGMMNIERGFVTSLIGAQIEDEETYNSQLEFLLNEVYLDLNQRGNLFIGIDNKLNDLDMFPNANWVYSSEMLSSKYDVAKIGAHGSAVSFGSFNEWGSIIIDVDYAQSNNITPMLLIETSCNSAAIDQHTNLACEFLFNPNNNVVTYSGATSAQGGQGETSFGRASNFIAENLVEGVLLGESLLSPMYHPYVDGIFSDYRENFSAQQIVLGDGSLKLQEFMK